MKKLLVLLFLMLIGTSIYAQKSYVNVVGEPYNDSDSRVWLNGAVPSDMKKNYYYKTDSVLLGDVLNMLAERGFVIEQMSCTNVGSSGYMREAIILSKDGTTPSQSISKGDVNIDGEVNIADVNEVISLILGIVREHPEILEQIKKQTNH